MALVREDCRRYLESLRMGEGLVERGLEAVAAIQRFLPARPEHIFVSERWDKEDGWSVGSLWFFGPGFISEGYRFTTESGFDITRVDQGVARLAVDRHERDCKGAEERSRLTVTLNFDSDIVGVLDASGDNCRALEGILEQYLVPLLAKR